MKASHDRTTLFPVSLSFRGFGPLISRIKAFSVNIKTHMPQPTCALNFAHCLTDNRVSMTTSINLVSASGHSDRSANPGKQIVKSFAVACLAAYCKLQLHTLTTRHESQIGERGRCRSAFPHLFPTI